MRSVSGDSRRFSRGLIEGSKFCSLFNPKNGCEKAREFAPSKGIFFKVVRFLPFCAERCLEASSVATAYYMRGVPSEKCLVNGVPRRAKNLASRWCLSPNTCFRFLRVGDTITTLIGEQYHHRMLIVSISSSRREYVLVQGQNQQSSTKVPPFRDRIKRVLSMGAKMRKNARIFTPRPAPTKCVGKLAQCLPNIYLAAPSSTRTSTWTTTLSISTPIA